MQRLSAYSPILIALALIALLLSAAAQPAAAQSTRNNAAIKGKVKSKETDGPADYRSEHFLVHTDLSADDAKELLDRLEYMLDIISGYWGRQCSGIIECYVVDDLNKWPGDTLDPEGRAYIEAGAGVTKSLKLTGSKGFLAKSMVYATAEGGVAQHEAVHAYCQQTFGTTGPTWYSEGMAEMGQYWKKGEKAVNCDPRVAEYLRMSEPKSLNEIVNRVEYTGDSWQNYAWRWALCHLLATNTNYAPKFRPLGLSILTDKKATFEQVYGDMDDEISFEYKQFIKHVDVGYRVDLCSWDWKRKFLVLKGPTAVTVKIAAQRGWQATGATLQAGQAYEYSTKGTWQTSADSKAVGANGDEGDAGKLLGVLFDNFELTEPFELGESGTYTSPVKGNLYLRCREEWTKLADNKGQIAVKLKALPKSKQAAE